MRNKLFWALAIGVSLVVAAIAWVAFTSLPDYGLSDPVAAVCAVAFLLVAFVAWEVLMKPGYGLLSRRREEDGEEPPSPPAP